MCFSRFHLRTGFAVRRAELRARRPTSRGGRIMVRHWFLNTGVLGLAAAALLLMAGPGWAQHHGGGGHVGGGHVSSGWHGGGWHGGYYPYHQGYYGYRSYYYPYRSWYGLGYYPWYSSGY